MSYKIHSSIISAEKARASSVDVTRIFATVTQLLSVSAPHSRKGEPRTLLSCGA